MSNLTDSQLMALADFNSDRFVALKADLLLQQAVDAAVASGALDLSRVVSELAVVGPVAYTLAAPTAPGQKKIIRCITATTSPAGTLTITSPDTTAGFVCGATFVFTDVGQEIELSATTALKWRCVRVKRAGGAADNVVVGTTVLTGYALWLRYCLSIDGTKNSTGANALPNGSAVGERCIITNSTASNTPIGSIDGVYTGMIGTAYTHIGAIGVVASTTVIGDMAMLEWTGSAWAVIFQNGCTLS